MSKRDEALSTRLPEGMFTAVHEAIGAATMCWIPKPSSQVFDSNKASEIALELCHKIADERSLLLEAAEAMLQALDAKPVIQPERVKAQEALRAAIRQARGGQ